MSNDRRERIKLALDIMVSFGKLLGSHVLGLKYDGIVVVMAPIVRYDSSLIFETLVFSFPPGLKATQTQAQRIRPHSPRVDIISASLCLSLKIWNFVLPIRCPGV